MSIKDLADHMKATGRRGDTELVHMTKGEVAGLQQLAMAAGGNLTINPQTGLPEASFLKQMLPTILGMGAMLIPGMAPVGAAMIGGAAGMMTNKDDPLMGAITGGLGGFGGASLGAGMGLGGAGAAGATTGAGLQANIAAAPVSAAGAPVGSFAAPNYALNAPSAAGMSASALPSAGGAVGLQAPSGALALGSGPQSMTGMQMLRSGSMAMAPGLMPQTMGSVEDDTEMPRFDYTAGLTGDYFGTGGDNSTRERRFFTQPTFTRRAAQGGIMSLAEGGALDQSDPARGMTGASAEAMRYLMGQTDTSPARAAQQQMMQQMAQDQAAVPVPAAAEPKKVLPPHQAAIGGMFGRAFGDLSTGITFGDASGGGNQVFGVGRREDAAPRFSFDPQTQQFTRLAEGGIASLAQGGMEEGGFVIPADVVSMAGEGNTDAGYERIRRMVPGATPIKGKDGGQADTVRTSIEGKQPAAVAHGEMYLPPAAVKKAGGAKKLYAMMDSVREQAKGSKKQIKPVNMRKALA